MSDPARGIQSSRLQRLSQDALARRLEIVDQLSRNRIEPDTAAVLLRQDADRLTGAVQRVTRSHTPRPARWLWVKVRPEGWSRRLSLPLPLALVRLALGLAARHQRGQGLIMAGSVDLSWADLRDLIGSLPRCGRLLQLQDDGQYVEIWLT
jgi:hypothetical protein